MGKTHETYGSTGTGRKSLPLGRTGRRLSGKSGPPQLFVSLAHQNRQTNLAAICYNLVTIPLGRISPVEEKFVSSNYLRNFFHFGAGSATLAPFRKLSSANTL